MERRNADSVDGPFCRMASGVWGVCRWGEVLHKTMLMRKRGLSKYEWAAMKVRGAEGGRILCVREFFFLWRA